MHSLITSYLLQSNECVLPGIGTLQIVNNPAYTDAANKLIVPPSKQIIFKREFSSKFNGLVQYLAAKNHIGQSNAEELINNFCKEWLVKINDGKKLCFETIGYLQKNSEGEIAFTREHTAIHLQSIPLDNPYMKALQHEQPEEESKLPRENVIKDEVIMDKSYWGIWALILFAIGAVIIFFHFKNHELSVSSSGNQNHVITDSVPATYTIPGK